MSPMRLQHGVEPCLSGLATGSLYIKPNWRLHIMSRKSLFQLLGTGAFAGAASLATVLALPSSGVSAQPFPNRPITVISPLGPGTPQDVITRAMAEIVAKDLRQPVIVENRAGAAATLGPAAMAATAKPDGYTVSAVVSTLALVPLMQKVAY